MGSEYTFTVRDPSTVKGIAFGVSYDAFIDDVQVLQLCTLPQHECDRRLPAEVTKHVAGRSSDGAPGHDMAANMERRNVDLRLTAGRLVT